MSFGDDTLHPDVTVEITKESARIYRLEEKLEEAESLLRSVGELRESMCSFASHLRDVNGGLVSSGISNEGIVSEVERLHARILDNVVRQLWNDYEYEIVLDDRD